MSELNNMDAIADQIYQEGIEKVKQEADEILQNAREEAGQLVKEAEKKAEQVLNKANAEAERRQKSALNEAKVKARQALSDLKADIEQIITSELLEQPAKKAFNNNEFMAELLIKAVGHWNESDEIEVNIPESLQDAIHGFIKSKHSEVLKTINIKPSAEVKNGFIIKQSSQGYFVSFSDDDFIAYLKPYFSKSLQQLLFE